MFLSEINLLVTSRLGFRHSVTSASDTEEYLSSSSGSSSMSAYNWSYTVILYCVLPSFHCRFDFLQSWNQYNTYYEFKKNYFLQKEGKSMKEVLCACARVRAQILQEKSCSPLTQTISCRVKDKVQKMSGRDIPDIPEYMSPNSFSNLTFLSPLNDSELSFVE